MNPDDYYRTLCSLAQIDSAIMTMMTIRMTLAQGVIANAPASTPASTYGVFVVCSYTDGESAYIDGLAASMTIGELRAEIELAVGVPMTEQQLFYGSVELRDDQTLADAGVDANATIWLCRTPMRPICMENLPPQLKY
jgi:hypothetical protein